MTFRIFTNDRGEQRGVFMYSCYREIQSSDVAHAQGYADRVCSGLAYRGEHGPVKVIEWPPTLQESKDWLAKHVG